MVISVLILSVQFPVSLIIEASFSFRQSSCNISHHLIYQLQLLTVMLLVIVIAYWVHSVVSYFCSCMSLRSRFIRNRPHYLGYSFWLSLLLTYGIDQDWLITFPFQIIHTSLFLGHSHLWTPLLSFSLLVLLSFVFFFPFSPFFRRFLTLWAQGRYLYTVFIAAAPYTAYSYLTFLTSAPCRPHSLAPTSLRFCMLQVRKPHHNLVAFLRRCPFCLYLPAFYVGYMLFFRGGESG